MAKFNFYLGATASSWLLAILIIAAELYGPFKNLLKSTFSHHWIGKGIWATILFVVVASGYYFIKKIDTSDSTTRFMRALAWTLIFGALTLFLFFTYEFFKH